MNIDPSTREGSRAPLQSRASKWAVGFLILLVVAPLANAADEPANDCRARLRTLGGAVKAYRLLHDDKSPAKLSDLFLEGLADSLADFVCPGSGSKISAASDIDAKSDFALGSGEILVREKVARHDGKALAVFADGAIKSVDGPLLARTEPGPVVPVDKPRPAQPDEKPKTIIPPIVPPTNPPTSPSTNPAGGSGSVDLMGLTFAYQPDGRLLVAGVQPNSPAAEVGIRVGDQVTELNEKPVPKGTGRLTAADFGKLVNVAAGDDVLLTIRQAADGGEIILNLPVGPAPVQLIPPGTPPTIQRPAPEAPTLGPRPTGYLGADFDTTSESVRILKITPRSPAEAAGLRAADVILAINSDPIESSQQLNQRLLASPPGATLNLLVVRDGKPKKITVTLGASPAVRK
jgi:predicted metalloprotease with PDZ domain